MRALTGRAIWLDYPPARAGTGQSRRVVQVTSVMRRHGGQAGRNVPFNPLCGPTSYVHGKGRLPGTHAVVGTTSRIRTMDHANTAPSAPGSAAAALEATPLRLRDRHRGPGRPGGLGH